MSKRIESSVECIVLPIVSGLGYEYIGTEVKKVGDEIELIIFVDKDGGLDLHDCEIISRAVEPKIEEEDPIEEGYYLCVSSPGLDRPLKTKADYQRSISKMVDVKLYRPDEKSKEFSGPLVSFDENGFTIVVDENEKTFLYKDAAIVRLHVDI